MIFGNKKISKSAFNKNKEPIYINGVDINKIVISKTESHGKKRLNTLLGMMIMMILDDYA